MTSSPNISIAKTMFYSLNKSILIVGSNFYKLRSINAYCLIINLFRDFKAILIWFVYKN